MNSSCALLRKCLLVRCPMKLLSAQIRTTPSLSPENKSGNHSEINITDIDVNNMFNEDEELASLFRRSGDPKKAGDSIIGDMQKILTVIDEQPQKGALIPPPTVTYEDK